MNRERTIGIALIVLGIVLVAIRLALGGGITGKTYSQSDRKRFVQVETIVTAEDGSTSSELSWVPEDSPAAVAPNTVRTAAEPIDWEQRRTVDERVYLTEQQAIQDSPMVRQSVYFSMGRTIGVWWAAFLTLAIFSFLYKDNPLYKFAESVFIGMSAAYWMVVAFWSVLVPNLFAKLMPNLVQGWAMPGLSGEQLHTEYVYIVPLILGAMLLWRLAPKGGWIARWPLAFFIGVFAGLKMVSFIHGDFLNQIKNGIVPLIAMAQQMDAAGNPVLDSNGNPETSLALGESIKNIIMVGGVLACLTYFFFSIEHKGAVGKISRVGVWILMITFGAMFGYTVMGRITLFSARLEFLFDDWLWLIDPTGRRGLISMILTWRL
jgi:hypothetical protein